ncbi:MAG: hypothetical protein ACM3JK_02650 [Betaproteobacteria bacterium]
MLAPVTHIIPLATIIRPRLLPTAGTIQVRSGDKVTPVDVVAETTIAREHILIDIAHALGVSPSKADRLVKCTRGDKIAKNTVIAKGDGIIPRSVRAPRDGRVVAIGGGQVMLEVGETPFELRAGYPGVVAQIMENRGVVIQTSGALIQGIWGNGRMDFGLMFNLAEQPNHVLSPADVDVSLRGSIILAGHVGDEKVFRNAADLPVRGMILGSMASSLAPVAMQMKYPILVVEGLGRRDMNLAAHKLLSTNAKRDVAINAEPFDRYAGTRPEVVIQLPVTQEPPLPRDLEKFAPGQSVRILRNPSQGAVGTLEVVRNAPTFLPNGLRAMCADVRLETNESLVVPLANLEVLG